MCTWGQGENMKKREREGERFSSMGKVKVALRHGSQMGKKKLGYSRTTQGLKKLKVTLRPIIEKIK